MFRHEVSKTICVSTNVESNLLLPLPLCNVIWHNFLGPFISQYKSFRLQKRIIRIITGSRSRDSCRKLFTSFKILPFPSLYIYFLLRFVIKNRELFTTNNEIRKFSTRQHHNFHQPSANLKKYQTGVFYLYMGIKIYNSLPTYIKNESNNTKRFESLLKNFLYENSFYSLEFYNYCKTK